MRKVANETIVQCRESFHVVENRIVGTHHVKWCTEKHEDRRILDDLLPSKIHYFGGAVKSDLEASNTTVEIILESFDIVLPARATCRCELILVQLRD